MNVRLVIERGGRRKVLNLKPPEAVVGRSHGNTVRIPSSDVSRRHCRLLMEDGLVKLEDLDSVNGTFLNGRRITGSQVVRPGDSVEVGPVKFVIEYELSPKALNRLRQNDNPLDVLRALADGEVLDEASADDVPYVEPFDDDDVVEVAPLDSDVVEVDPIDEDLDEVLPVEEDDLSDEKTGSSFDASTWQMPKGEDIRGILHDLEEDAAPPKRRPPPKKRK